MNAVALCWYSMNADVRCCIDDIITLFRYGKTRFLVGTWKLREVKTKKTGFLARFADNDDDDDDGDGGGGGGGSGGSCGRKSGRATPTTTDLKTKYDRAGSEAKLYLFNDAVMITRKRTGGNRVCKQFAPLGRVELIGADGGLAVFGLNVLDGEGGGKQKCHVFKGGSTADSIASFIAAIQAEMAMLQMRRRSEVLLPGAGMLALENNVNL